VELDSRQEHQERQSSEIVKQQLSLSQKVAAVNKRVDELDSGFRGNLDPIKEMIERVQMGLEEEKQ